MSVVKCENTETNKYELEIAVDAEMFAAATERVYKKQRGQISVPGFRKGKAPRSLIEKMYGEGVFFEDAVEELYPIALQSAIVDEKLEPVARPDVEMLSVSKEDGFTFKATVTVKPAVTVKDYKGIAVTRPSEKVGAEEIEAELKTMAERNARQIDVDDRPAQTGDTVVFDFEGFVDGEAFEGGKAEGHEMVLGSHQFIEGFEEQIAGRSVGDEFEVNVTFPEQYQAENLAGKPAVFKCKLHGVKVKELPELDDEFAKDLGEYETIAEVRESIVKRLGENKKRASDSAVENALIDTVIANMEAEIPPVMYENKIDEMVRDFEYRLQSQGIQMEMYYQYTGMDAASFRKTFAAQAEKQVKIRLALEQVVKDEEIVCADEELDAEFAKLAEQYKQDIERIRTMISPIELREDLCVNKAIDLIKSSAVVTNEDGEEAPAAETSAAE